MAYSTFTAAGCLLPIPPEKPEGIIAIGSLSFFENFGANNGANAQFAGGTILTDTITNRIGAYTVRRSSYNATNYASNAFLSSSIGSTTTWLSNNSGAITNTMDITGVGTGITCEWIEILCPNPFKLNNYTITTHNTYNTNYPKNWYVCGSNDGITYTLVDTKSVSSQPTANLTVSSNSYLHYPYTCDSSSTHYYFYRIAVRDSFNTTATNFKVAIANWTLSGEFATTKPYIIGWLPSYIISGSGLLAGNTTTSDGSSNGLNMRITQSSINSDNRYVGGRSFLSTKIGSAANNEGWNSQNRNAQQNFSVNITVKLINNTDLGVNCEWLQIQSTTAFILNHYNIFNFGDFNVRLPRRWFMCGANDVNGPYYVVDDRYTNPLPLNSPPTKNCTINSINYVRHTYFCSVKTTPYLIYRIVIIDAYTQSGEFQTQIHSLQLYGTFS